MLPNMGTGHVTIGGGLNVGGTTDPGDNNLRVEGTGYIGGQVTGGSGAGFSASGIVSAGYLRAARGDPYIELWPFSGERWQWKHDGSGSTKCYFYAEDTAITVLTLDSANGGRVGIGTNAPDTKLDLNGVLTLRESAQPSAPDSGASQIWMSNGTGTGDAGDIMVIINSGGTIKTNTLIDFSAI